MKRQIFPTASKYRRRTRREFGGETVEYIIVILAVVVIGGGLMGFGNQVSGQIGKTGNSISSWFGKANGAGDNASAGLARGVIAKVSNLPEGANQVSYQWQYSPTKTGTFSDIEYGGNKNSYEISEEDEDYYLRCKVTTSSRAISPTDGLNAPASEAAPSLLPRNSAPAHLYLSQVYRDRASIAR